MVKIVYLIIFVLIPLAINATKSSNSNTYHEFNRKLAFLKEINSTGDKQVTREYAKKLLLELEFFGNTLEPEEFKMFYDAVLILKCGTKPKKLF